MQFYTLFYHVFYTWEVFAINEFFQVDEETGIIEGASWDIWLELEKILNFTTIFVHKFDGKWNEGGTSQQYYGYGIGFTYFNNCDIFLGNFFLI